MAPNAALGADADADDDNDDDDGTFMASSSLRLASCSQLRTVGFELGKLVGELRLRRLADLWFCRRPNWPIFSAFKVNTF